MDGRRVSDFSIDRILSPQVQFSADPHLPHLPPPHGGFALASGSLGPPAPPVQVTSCWQLRGPSLGEAVYPPGAGFHHANFYVCPNAGGSGPAAYCYLADVSAQPQTHLRQKQRARTVFTDAQTRKLEALFALTDYPAAEARAAVSSSTGLSEETVRVWFKNRRARRKRQRSGSKVNPPPTTGGAAGERSLFASFL